ncbi:hypothetical protein QQ045_016897 [Rhodiola kirilowii]
MGSERVLGGVAARELETVRESERVPADRNKPLVIQKDGTREVADPRCATRGSSAPCMRQGSQSDNLRLENVIERNFSKGDPVRLGSSRSDDWQLLNKCKKLSKNGSGCSKRPRLAQMEDSLSLDKGQIHKQKTNCGGKRCDKKNPKVSSRTKYDSFSLKNGTTSFNSSSGGHNVLGYYGLKPDLHDITKQVNELSLTEHSLEELLDDTFLCQDVDKDRGNNTKNTNEKVVQSIKTVCSILVPQRPAQLEASSELEANLIKRVSPGMPFASYAPSSIVDGKRDSNVIGQYPENKESSSCPEIPANALDFPLYSPSVILERLRLQPPDNLESLLLGDMRTMSSARDGFDSRPGKRIATQPYLPAFSWSHSFGGHCKSTSDALKISISRSSCQGSRWARIGHTASICGVASNDFTDFTKFSLDPNLVPEGGLVSVNLASGGTWSVSEPTLAAPDSRASIALQDEHPPSSVIAAQTLCNIATQSMPPDLSQILLLRRPKKPLEKAMKAQKFKYVERSEISFSRPKSLLGYDSVGRHTDQATPSKKTKLTSSDKKKDVTLINGITKGPLIWSGPKSCRSSSYRSVKDTKSENKHRSSDLSKPSIGLPPVRILEKGSNSQQKPRKVVQVYWDR